MVTADEHKSVMEHALHLVGDPADGTGIIEKMFKAMASGIYLILSTCSVLWLASSLIRQAGRQ